ncbi:major capsid protein [Pseudomonas sp. Z8(2022)]|uniref:major capsid protein n=1 Tax=Pseudomonas sp. Z8(2022) TaxID=2962597 RepID=UPI0021F46696|nr:major capsid protein [Pseudomonas sp. Z8(2022)]UYP28530.1 major capsid protein [Pseudomonas sp. Z8(2022)]UYP28540.1 major capsid protein [Pseudomonas sp. Z8(2022)]UYP32490.1 major capsid protein [Pseudomonas sp. Z8(2022)]
MKAFNVVRKYGRQAAVAATSLLAVPAFAAVDTTELDGAKTDAMAVCAIVFGILVAIAAYKYVRRAL